MITINNVQIEEEKLVELDKEIWIASKNYKQPKI